APDVEEQAVRVLEDVGLVHERDALALVAAGELERVAHDALRAVARDHRDRLRRHPPRPDVVLDARVDVLGVLAHHDEVDVVVAARHARDGAHRPHVGEEIEVLPERHVDRAVALALGGRERPLEREAGVLDRVDGPLRQRILLLLDGGEPRDLLVELQLGAGAGEDLEGGGADLRPDAVAANQRDGALAHARSILNACIHLPSFIADTTQAQHIGSSMREASMPPRSMVSQPNSLRISVTTFLAPSSLPPMNMVGGPPGSLGSTMSELPTMLNALTTLASGSQRCTCSPPESDQPRSSPLA